MDYIIYYKNGEVATCCTSYYLRKLTRFRRVRTILKRVRTVSGCTYKSITKKDVKFEKDGF